MADQIWQVSDGVNHVPLKVVDNGDGTYALAISPAVTAGSAFGASAYQDFGTVTKANVKNSAGKAWAAVVNNKNGASRYFQIHDKATAPVATEVPLLSFLLPPGSANNPSIREIPYDVMLGLACTLGVSWAISTTEGTFTDAATAAEHSVIVRYS